MLRSQMNSAEVASIGQTLYDKNIRSKVETDDNIGKMVIIDIETGEYQLDDSGFDASKRFHINRPDAPLYGIRIGYNVVTAIGGVMKRVDTQ